MIRKLNFVCFLSLFISCNKDNLNNIPLTVVGNWNWILTYPGGNPSAYPYYPFTPLNTGKKMGYIFNENNSFSKSLNDTTIQSGTFSTGHGNYLPYVGAYNNIYDSVNFYISGIKVDTKFYYKNGNDTLVFCSGCRGIAGGGSEYFTKK